MEIVLKLNLGCVADVGYGGGARSFRYIRRSQVRLSTGFGAFWAAFGLFATNFGPFRPILG